MWEKYHSIKLGMTVEEVNKIVLIGKQDDEDEDGNCIYETDRIRYDDLPKFFTYEFKNNKLITIEEEW